MPSNKNICESAVDSILGNKTNIEVKHNFSDTFIEVLDLIYKSYLKHEDEIGQKIIDTEISSGRGILLSDLNKFMLSISQSRKSRAGKAFEFAIESLLSKLSYRFSSQVKGSGITTDFVLPSREHYNNKPLDSIILTAKRTLRERWKQVILEANNWVSLFLVTIDENVSQDKNKQAELNIIYIVVPKSLKASKEPYINSYNVLSFESFFEKHLDPALVRWGGVNPECR